MQREFNIDAAAMRRLAATAMHTICGKGYEMMDGDDDMEAKSARLSKCKPSPTKACGYATSNVFRVCRVQLLVRRNRYVMKCRGPGITSRQLLFPHSSQRLPALR